MSDQPTTAACTCTPLNRRLMAHLLGIEEGAVHEQGCLDRAVAELRADLAAKVRGLWTAERERFEAEPDETVCLSEATVLALIEGEPR